MQQDLFLELLTLLAAAVVAVALFRRFAMPPILAYLSVGVLLGPHGFGFVADSEDIHFLAEFGVVFLLFIIGLEFSLPQLVAMRGVVLGLGGAQVVITTLVAGIGTWLLGMTPQGAFVAGGALAMSSTAVVVKQLTEQAELHTRHGRLALGILLFQDLAVVPFLIIIPALAGHNDEPMAWTLGWALVKGITAVVGMLAAGRWLLRPLFHEVASARSAELFTLTALLVALTAAEVTQWLGLSLALGAFLAGMMLGETEYRHQVEADIRPFQDVLLGLFFITIGMLVDLHALPGVLHWALLGLAALMIVKALLIMGLAMTVSGAELGVALRVGLVLAQGGEFGFALLSLALSGGFIRVDAAQIILATVVLSMAVTPLLIRHSYRLAQRLCCTSYTRGLARMEKEVAQSAYPLKDHVILCGYGRTGQSIGHFLEQEGIEFVALDMDPTRVQEARAAGDPVHYGDSSRRQILEAAGLHRARLLVVTFNDLPATLKLLPIVRHARPDLPVLVRTRNDANMQRLQEAGATEVIPETLEASLMLATEVLLMLEVPGSRAFRRAREARADRYRLLRGFFHGTEPVAGEAQGAFREQLHAVTLPEGAHAVGHTLAEIGLDDWEVSVTAVRRGGIRGPQPEPDTRLRAHDVLVLYGEPDGLSHAEERLLTGRL